jgi:hypothetical protein
MLLSPHPPTAIVTVSHQPTQCVRTYQQIRRDPSLSHLALSISAELRHYSQPLEQQKEEEEQEEQVKQERRG